LRATKVQQKTTSPNKGEAAS